MPDTRLKSLVDKLSRISKPLGTGSGDVTGPASSVDNELALFDGTTGKTLKRGTWTNDGQHLVAPASNAEIRLSASANPPFIYSSADNNTQFRFNQASECSLTVANNGAGIASLTVAGNINATAGNITVTGTVDGRDVATDGAKLDGIDAGAQVNDVSSVFGRTGAVVATEGDYDLGLMGDVDTGGVTTNDVLFYNGAGWAPLNSTGSGDNVMTTSPTIATPTLTLRSGSPTAEGDIRWNPSLDKIMVGDGSATLDFLDKTKLLQVANNLSDVNNAATSVSNLTAQDKCTLKAVTNGDDTGFVTGAGAYTTGSGNKVKGDFGVDGNIDGEATHTVELEYVAPEKIPASGTYKLRLWIITGATTVARIQVKSDASDDDPDVALTSNTAQDITCTNDTWKITDITLDSTAPTAGQLVRVHIDLLSSHANWTLATDSQWRAELMWVA